MIPRGAVGDSRLRGAFALQFVQHNRDGIASLSIPSSRLRRATSLLNPSVAAAPRHLPFKKGRHYGRHWAVLLHTVVPLSKRLPFKKGELAAKPTEGMSPHSRPFDARDFGRYFNLSHFTQPSKTSTRAKKRPFVQKRLIFYRKMVL